MSDHLAAAQVRAEQQGKALRHVVYFAPVQLQTVQRLCDALQQGMGCLPVQRLEAKFALPGKSPYAHAEGGADQLQAETDAESGNVRRAKPGDDSLVLAQHRVIGQRPVCENAGQKDCVRGKPADLTDLLVIEDDHLVCPQTPHDTLQVGNVAQPLGQSIAHRIGDQTGTFGALLVGQDQNSFHERYSLQYNKQ